MNELLDLDRYPLDRPDSQALAELVIESRQALKAHGMFNLEGLVRPAPVAHAALELVPRFEQGHRHERWHNVYFDDDIPVTANHPALTRFHTTHRTLCADQIEDSIVSRIYEWPPLAAFIAAVLERPRLYLMDDPLARINVMEYGAGETLNWHFDRSRFTTTLLLQAADEGGEFEYMSDLRGDDDPNYEGVGRFLRDHAGARVNPLTPGTLNVFAGRHTLHRVSTVRGDHSRIVAVFSYYEKPGVQFSGAERIGFYGRAS
jgi:hypothetical protein